MPYGCNWKPPFPLPTYPISVDEAAEYEHGNLNDMLDQEFDGECICGEEYVPPTCENPCVTCEQNTGPLFFIVPEIDGEFEDYDGNYGLTKTGVGENPCGWTGNNGSLHLIPATITWVDGVWTLTLGEDAAAVYQYEGGPCESSFVMTRVSGDSSFPPTINVFS